MSNRSSTGTWIVTSGPTSVGPFDGVHAADAFAREARQAGFEAKAVRLHAPHEARRAMRTRTDRAYVDAQRTARADRAASATEPSSSLVRRFSPEWRPIYVGQPTNQTKEQP